MDMIYGDAFLTIVAATGDNAGAGLPGYRRNTRGRPQARAERIGPDLSLIVLPHWDAQLGQSTYAHRGWTLQEGRLSRRCLIFLNGQVYFCCNRALWREDVAAEDPKARPIYSHMLSHGILGFLNVLTDPLNVYGSMVQQFSLRSLTKQSDAVPAFTGIARALSTVLGDSRF